MAQTSDVAWIGAVTGILALCTSVGSLTVKIFNYKNGGHKVKVTGFVLEKWKGDPLMLSLVPVTANNYRRGSVTIDRLLIAPAGVWDRLAGGRNIICLNIRQSELSQGNEPPKRLEGIDSEPWVVDVLKVKAHWDSLYPTLQPTKLRFGVQLGNGNYAFSRESFKREWLE